MPELLFLLLLMVLLAIPVGLILAISAYRRADRLAREVRALTRSVHRVEDKLAEVEARQAPATEPAESSPDSAERGDAVAEKVESVQPRPAAAAAEAETVSAAVDSEPHSESDPTPEEAPAQEAQPSTPLPPPIPTAASRPRLGLEELLSTKVIVWIAAVAVALSGVFLVRYFVEQGLLTEPMKVTLAALLGVAMIVGGEVVRRRGLLGIAQGLVAAGVPCLYAAILGLVHYDLAPTSIGLGLLGICTAGVVALSLRHGALVATLGLIGGFLMPALIGARTEPPFQLFGYMLLLQIGLLSLARHRTWWWLTIPALGAGLLWATVWIATTDNLDDRSWVFLFLAASAAAFVAASSPKDESEASGVQKFLGWLALAPSLVLSAALVNAGNFTNFDWFQLGLLCAATLALGRFRPFYVGVPWIAAALVGLLLTNWGGGFDAFHLGSHRGQAFAHHWLTVAAGFASLFALGGYACLWGSGREHTWSRLCGVAGVGFLSLMYAVTQPLTFGMPWWGWGVAAAGLYGLLAVPIAQRRAEWKHGNAAFGNLCVAASALVALSVWWGIGQNDAAHRSWITIAWGLELPVIALLGARLQLPKLLKTAGVLGVLIGVRLVSNTVGIAQPVGEGLIFNWLLYGYGVPAVAFFASARIARAVDRPTLTSWFDGGCIWSLFLMLSLLIRHGFDQSYGPRDFATLFELGTFSALWGGYGLALVAIGHWRKSAVAAKSGLLIFALSLATALFGSGFLRNPLLQSWPVGETPIFNGLLFLFGVPALLAFVGARLLHYAKHARAAVGWTGVCGLILTFGLITLEVRHYFVGSVLTDVTPTPAEAYAYSAAWIVFALVLLGVALTVRTPIKAQIRWGSLAVMLAAVGKVFLYDLRELQDLWRVVSFLGLGLTLFAVSLLYQKFVFTSTARADSEEPPEPLPES